MNISNPLLKLIQASDHYHTLSQQIPQIMLKKYLQMLSFDWLRCYFHSYCFYFHPGTWLKQVAKRNKTQYVLSCSRAELQFSCVFFFVHWTNIYMCMLDKYTYTHRQFSYLYMLIQISAISSFLY